MLGWLTILTYTERMSHKAYDCYKLGTLRKKINLICLWNELFITVRYYSVQDNKKNLTGTRCVV